MISQLLWFCIATLCDRLKNFAPFSQPIRSKTKSNRNFLARVFPRLAAAPSSDWFIRLSASVVIGQSNCIGFGFTTIN